MKRLFAQIRWRLVGWTMLVVSLILGLLGGAVYTALARGLAEQADSSLLSRAEQVGPGLFGDRRGPGPGPGQIPGDPRDSFRDAIFYLAVSPDNQVLANPRRINLDIAALPAPMGRTPAFATMDADGDPVRVLVRALPDGGRLVVGESLAADQAALQALLVVLLGGGGLGLLLTFAGAWFLSGRALVPIQQAFYRQQEFVADASHELRTPLTVLQSSAEILNQHRDEPITRNAELFDDVRDEIKRMVRLTSDLLTLARTDRGELDLMTAPIDLAELAGDVVRRAQPLALAKGIALSAATASERPTVDADPDRIQQVLLILLDNAIKHTPAGGRVDVLVHRQGSSAYLDVSDTGEGIAPQHLSRIFDRFYRADAARSREQGGTGLGLAIARTLVNAHGGEISASSVPGEGTRVSVRLPLDGGTRVFGQRLSKLAAHFSPAHARH